MKEMGLNQTQINLVKTIATSVQRIGSVNNYTNTNPGKGGYIKSYRTIVRSTEEQENDENIIGSTPVV